MKAGKREGGRVKAGKREGGRVKVVRREGSGGREIEKADLVGVNGVVVIHGKLPGERDRHAVDYYGDDE